MKVPPVSNDTCLDAFNSYFSDYYNYDYYNYNYGEIENPFDNDSMICAGKKVKCIFAVLMKVLRTC